MPPHRLNLKVGMVIILLRNFDQQNGHCNGSRYVIEQILPHLLVAKSVIGVIAGCTLLIPRITLIPSDNIFPFTLRWKQFPVRPCFAMTVNKSRGQSLQHIGVFCKGDFLSHGQYYVAASRVGRSNRLRILALDEETKKKRYFLSNVGFRPFYAFTSFGYSFSKSCILQFDQRGSQEACDMISRLLERDI